MANTDKDTKIIMLNNIQYFLEDNFAPDEVLKSFEWLENYISDLELELEINKTLAETERKSFNKQKYEQPKKI